MDPGQEKYKLASPRKAFFLATFFSIFNKRLLRQTSAAQTTMMVSGGFCLSGQVH